MAIPGAIENYFRLDPCHKSLDFRKSSLPRPRTSRLRLMRSNQSPTRSVLSQVRVVSYSVTELSIPLPCAY